MLGHKNHKNSENGFENANVFFLVLSVKVYDFLHRKNTYNGFFTLLFPTGFLESRLTQGVPLFFEVYLRGRGHFFYWGFMLKRQLRKSED